jgi:hypothetical protein
MPIFRQTSRNRPDFSKSELVPNREVPNVAAIADRGPQLAFIWLSASGRGKHSVVDPSQRELSPTPKSPVSETGSRGGRECCWLATSVTGYGPSRAGDSLSQGLSQDRGYAAHLQTTLDKRLKETCRSRANPRAPPRRLSPHPFLCPLSQRRKKERSIPFIFLLVASSGNGGKTPALPGN